MPHDAYRWRGRMQIALHSHWFHIAIVLLVVMDAFIVLFELLLDVGAFSESMQPNNNFEYSKIFLYPHVAKVTVNCTVFQ